MRASALTPGALVLVTAVVMGGCGHDGSPLTGKIDERNGVFQEIRIGAETSSLDRLLGECQNSDNGAPCGEDNSEITEPHTFPGGWHWRTYQGVTYYTSPGLVEGFLITQPESRTLRGIEVGDSLDAARRAYPGMTCDVVHFEDDVPGGPYCRFELSTKLALNFGGDPIDSIVVARRGAG
jgi:hypothetical protein